MWLTQISLPLLPSPYSVRRPLWRLNYEAAHGHAAESRVVAIYGKSLLVDYGDAGAEEAGDAAAEGKGAGAGAGHAATGGGSASPSRAEGLVEAAEEPGSGETVVNTPDGGNGSDDDGSDDEEEDALDVLAWRLEGDAAEPPQLLRASSSVMVQAEAEGHWEHGLVVGPPRPDGAYPICLLVRAPAHRSSAEGAGGRTSPLFFLVANHLCFYLGRRHAKRTRGLRRSRLHICYCSGAPTHPHC